MANFTPVSVLHGCFVTVFEKSNIGLSAVGSVFHQLFILVLFLQFFPAVPLVVIFLCDYVVSSFCCCMAVLIHFILCHCWQC